MSAQKFTSGSAEYWRDCCHKAWERGDQDAHRVMEFRGALAKAADFLTSAATYQDRPGAMAEHEALAAELREVLVPPGVKALRSDQGERR
jgi:hypothetical protein